MPVQGSGHVDGYPWYFRARGAEWSVEIAEDRSINHRCLPLVGPGFSGWLIEEDWGKSPEAGYMDETIAWSIIERCFELFRAEQMSYVND